ncbi:porphobilinogen deaminase, dipyromethane cofactor binding domain-containing protein [Cantharellus anzutake]|uniref:porphobilinogen deaminase, dipyromethane cofactor binding domain-containing protein n=1 Tax=Cantharellus anzutake TaxID=1750568 RepID=UPI001907DE99|nr:porphobilinogen deaminase, dipyromethane cofactor binding domain-containing protein [Cantharellus anzutake]KAF8320594.1 porphobilinogen deaminase, dipyromethane cofactor binding domain-containing protein [Cantharellus anzutake]
MTRTFILGSRASQLAKVQTLIVRDALQTAFPHATFDVRFMITAGDKNQKDALYLLGGKSLWTEELEVALGKGEIDIIVHSLKDVSTVLPDGFEIGAIMEREDPDDAFVCKKGLGYTCLGELPDGSVVGTSSVRRVAQLKRAYPKLIFQDIRGNCDTRLRKLDDPNGPFTAIILASAGLIRLDQTDRITSSVTPPTLYHAVGQGALGIECRDDDVEVKDFLKKVISHYPTEMRCRAERACLRVLEGGCSVPVGVESSFVPAFSSAASSEEGDGKEVVGTLTLTSTVTSLSGELQVAQMICYEKVCGFDDAERLGEEVARALISGGARKILEEVNVKRAEKQKRDKEAKESSKVEPPLAHVDSFLNQPRKGEVATPVQVDANSTSSTPSWISYFSTLFLPISVEPKETLRQLPGAWPETS